MIATGRAAMIDVLAFYKAYSIPYKTSGSKHCQPGWVQIPCPFCMGNSGWHLGYRQSLGYYNCWRCGKHSETEVIKTLLGLNWSNAKALAHSLQTGTVTLGAEYEKIKKADVCHLPQGCKPMAKQHKAYLRSRGFNPSRIEKLWGVQGTSFYGPYSHRLIIPIYINGILVSYQGRDITGLAEAKYKACKKEDEVIDHKDCLYGIDKVPNKFVVVVVEGVTDVWRLGPGAVATFGIKFTIAQINQLRKFKKVILLFDSDPQAIEEQEKLAEILSSFNVEVEIQNIEDGDPGELKQCDADKLMKELLT